MGLIGFFITVVLMVLGAGYYYFGMSGSSITLTNDAPVPVAAGLGLYEDLKTKVTDIKKTEEERVAEEIASLEETLTVEKPKPTAVPEKEAALAITDRLMSAGFTGSVQTRNIDTIVLHSSYNPNGGDPYSVAKMIEIYDSYGVSAHYLIDRDGKIYRLVEDQNIAYHAGASKMPDGRTDVNNFSLGIEMLNQEDTEYTKAQYAAVNELVSYLKKKYAIKYVVGHTDIAPARKTDPWNFDWKKLQ